jgi:hypothetical protein
MRGGGEFSRQLGRVLALLVALCVCAACLPATAGAEVVAGSGSVGSTHPVQGATPPKLNHKLDALRELLAKNDAQRQAITHRIHEIESYRGFDQVLRAEYARLQTRLQALSNLHGSLLALIAGMERGEHQ